MNKKTIGIAVAIFLAGGLGTAVGSAGADTPAPAATITKTVQGPERVVTKEVTPQSCIDALDVMAIVLDAVSTEHEAFAAAGDKGAADGDVAAFVASLTGAVQDMTAVLDKQTNPLTAAAQGCRAATS